MYSRRDIRYSLHRAKKGHQQHPANVKEVLDWVLEQKPDDLHMSDFATEWDIIVTKNKTVEFVKPERDINYIQSVCAEAKVYAKMGQKFEENFDDRALNIITVIELAMLEGKMNWENYGTNWNVTLDVPTAQVSTRLLNVQPGQIEVTPEMIQASQNKRDASELDAETQRRIADKEAGISYDKSVDFTDADNAWEQMTPAQVAAIKKIMSSGE